MSDKRKSDHIELAFKSVPSSKHELSSCNYEPLFAAHPLFGSSKKTFLDFEFGLPLWVSSMTGGTAKALKINQNLARACKEFKMGMGLGSCRPLLDSNERFEDFNVRELMGDSPLYTNFGIAQLENLLEENNIKKIDEVTSSLQADGIIIHINPLQEWAQPEGDRYKNPPIDTIQSVLDATSLPVIVKEVGQGFGPKSLAALLKLPLAAIELAGFGGTNFTILEHARLSQSSTVKIGPKELFGHIGHTPMEMISWINEIVGRERVQCDNIIISGGVKDPITAHNLMQECQLNSVVGMASELLKYSMGEYEELQNYINELQESFDLAKAYIRG